MPRVKRGTHHVKRRKNLLKRTKGYRWGRKNLMKAAQTATKKAGAHAYRARREKKRTNRGLWVTKLNAAVHMHDMSYSVFIGKLKKAKIELNRKVLAEIAEHHPNVFEAIIQEVKK